MDDNNNTVLSAFVNSETPNETHINQPKSDYHRRVLTGTRKTEKSMEVWMFMKQCKGCNDYH